MTGRKWTGIVLAALALTGCRTAGPQPNAGAGAGREQSAGVAITPAVPSRRLVFPWSVVSGGVDSPLAMRTAMQADPVVEAHYAGLNPAEFRAETLPAKRRGYVSYRIRDKVYWTRGMVTLLAGETVLSDGRFLVRGRCGNLFSPTPREPVAPPELEPEEIDMDAAVREALLMQSPALPGEPAVETGTVINPKQIGNNPEITSVLPVPAPQEMMPPVLIAGGISSPGGGMFGIGGAPQSGPGLPVTAPPETPNPGAPFFPALTRPAPIEFPPPMVIASLLPLPETPIVTTLPFTPGYVWERPPPRNFPPGVTPMPPWVPPLVYYPPGENPPPPNTPPGIPPPPPPTGPPPPPTSPPTSPPTGPPPFDPPPSPPPGPPPPDMPVPEPGAWVLLVLGLAGIAAGTIRRKS